ncbi:MAG TPA: DegT/DnrJ/EryC1/StrS family aminotransferase [Terriglobales bacterium]|nr:DegT/DnrJ/EryC1/StrS family aminotransferase [Terriglobales bacterium]
MFNKSDSYIPFHRASIGAKEIEAVNEVLNSGWLTTGPVAHKFEKQFADYIGCKHALAVSTGTGALQLALDAIGLGPGDEVLVPTNTFTASGEVVTYFGATPVLCDIVEGEFNLDPAEIERKVTPKTRAVIPVHIAGGPCDMDGIEAVAKRHGLHVIEDAAHALPTRSKGRLVGNISELTAFSFYATKTITTGEGGMLTTNNDEYAERASVMRLHGIGRQDAWKRYTKSGSWYYEVVEAGYKLNLCDILAALGTSQLAQCDAFWRRRCELAAMYREALSGVEELQMPPEARNGDQHSWHLFILRLRLEDLAISRDEFIEQLKQSGVGASVHFIPLHRHPYYRETQGYSLRDFPNAEDTFSRCLSLPIYPDLRDDQLQRVVEAVTQIVASNRRAKAFAV